MEVLPPTGPDELGWSDNWHPFVHHFLINEPARRASRVYTKEALFYFTLFYMFYFLMLIVGVKGPCLLKRLPFSPCKGHYLWVSETWNIITIVYHTLEFIPGYINVFGAKPSFSCVSCNLLKNFITFDPEDSLIWLIFPSDLMDL